MLNMPTAQDVMEKLEYNKIYEVAEFIRDNTREDFIKFLSELEKEISDLSGTIKNEPLNLFAKKALIKVLGDLSFCVNKLFSLKVCDQSQDYNGIISCCQAIADLSVDAATKTLVSHTIAVIERTSLFIEMAKVRSGVMLIMDGCQLPARNETRRLPKMASV